VKTVLLRKNVQAKLFNQNFSTALTKRPLKTALKKANEKKSLSTFLFLQGDFTLI